MHAIMDRTFSRMERRSGSKDGPRSVTPPQERDWEGAWTLASDPCDCLDRWDGMVRYRVQLKKIVERSHCPLLFSSSSVHFQPPQLDLHDLRSASPSYAPDHDHHHHDGPPKTSIHPVGDSHSRGSFSRLLELADGYSAWRHRNQGCSGASRH